MSVASVWGLLRPALDEDGNGVVAAGLIVGAAFLVVARFALRSADPVIGGHHGSGVRRSVLVFSVLLVHSLPEGLAIGLMVALAAALGV